MSGWAGITGGAIPDKRFAEAIVTCSACPVQIEGRLVDGRWFYFRSRHERVQLGVSSISDDDAVWKTVHCDPTDNYIERDLSHLGEYGAGMISIPEAYDLLKEMMDEFIGMSP